MAIRRIAALMMALALGATASGDEPLASPDGLRITVLFNNLTHRPGLVSGWGFSCLVEGLEKTLLFDTGANGDILLANMRRLGLEPGAVEAVVLSHIHGDHAGGLDRFLDASPHVDVYLPAAFPASFQEAAARRGARVHPVEEGGRLFGSVYSTGGLDGGQAEQALIMDTSEGLVVVTGCAHPGIVPVAEAARRLTGRPIHLLMGGFHLRDESEAGIRRIITGLRALDVEKVAPSHCTGETARALLREAWGEDFIEGGLGAVIEVAAR